MTTILHVLLSGRRRVRVDRYSAARLLLHQPAAHAKSFREPGGCSCAAVSAHLPAPRSRSNRQSSGCFCTLDAMLTGRRRPTSLASCKDFQGLRQLQLLVMSGNEGSHLTSKATRHTPRTRSRARCQQGFFQLLSAWQHSTPAARRRGLRRLGWCAGPPPPRPGCHRPQTRPQHVLGTQCRSQSQALQSCQMHAL